jgi:hypothetical protein
MANPYFGGVTKNVAPMISLDSQLSSLGRGRALLKQDDFSPEIRDTLEAIRMQSQRRTLTA